MQIVFVPLSEERKAFVRDAGSKTATWLVEMGGSAQGAREGITAGRFSERHRVQRGPRAAAKRAARRCTDRKDAPPFHLEHCNQTIFPGKDGRGTQVPPGTTIEYTVRDLFDRPWARIWEEYFEKGMQRPAAQRHTRRIQMTVSGWRLVVGSWRPKPLTTNHQPLTTNHQPPTTNQDEIGRDAADGLR